MFPGIWPFTRAKSERTQAAQLERLDSGKWTRELLMHLEWRRVEELCCAYFEELGFKTGLTHDRADGAVDISLYAAGADTACMLVHCKAWDAYPIGIKPVRELRGAMTSANVAEGVMVAAGRFTPEATHFAFGDVKHPAHRRRLAPREARGAAAGEGARAPQVRDAGRL